MANRTKFDELLKRLRDNEIAVSQGESGLGVDAVSAPVFDLDGRIFIVITILAARGTMVMDSQSPTILAIQRAAADLSQRLGYRPPLPKRTPATAARA